MPWDELLFPLYGIGLCVLMNGKSLSLEHDQGPKAHPVESLIYPLSNSLSDSHVEGFFYRKDD